MSQILVDEVLKPYLKNYSHNIKVLKIVFKVHALKIIFQGRRNRNQTSEWISHCWKVVGIKDIKTFYLSPWMAG